MSKINIYMKHIPTYKHICIRSYKNVSTMQSHRPRLYGLVVSVSASHVVGSGFAPRSGHTKDHHKNGTNCLTD